MSNITTADYLLSALKREGVGHIFGVPGDYGLNLFRIIDQTYKNDFKLITTCDEQGAAYAVDGYARIHKFGALCVTYGVGALKVANGIAEAKSEKSPVLLISGAPATDEQNSDMMVHHKFGPFDAQHRIFKELTVSSSRITSENFHNITNEIDRVINDIKRYHGPGYIEIPVDLFEAKVELPSTTQFSEERKDTPNIKEVVNEAANMIRNAKSPVVMVGLEVHRFNLVNRVREWIEINNLPFVTSPLSKSVLPECHPNFVGVWAGPMSHKNVSQFIDQSDCFICLGYWPTDVNLGHKTGKIDPSKSIQLRENKIYLKDKNINDVDLKEFLYEISKLKKLKTDWNPFNIESPQTRQPFIPKAGAPITYDRLLQCINGILATNKNNLVVADVGLQQYSSCIELKGCNYFLSNAYYGSMGFAVPAAIGASLATPDSLPIVLVGDGSFQMTGVEISTAVKYKLKPLIIVINNKGYSTERLFEEGSFNNITNWNYHRIGDLINDKSINGRVISDEVELNNTIQSILSSRDQGSLSLSDKINLLEVMIDSSDLPSCMVRVQEAKKG